MTQLAAPPYQDPVVYPPDKPGTPIDQQLGGTMTPVWQQYQNLSIVQPLNQAPQQYTEKVETSSTQNASIGVTPIPLPPLGSGYYRVSLIARVTQAGTVSSSLIVTISFTQDTIACSFATAALTTNTTASVVTATYLLLIDEDTPISYSTTYASVGATPMNYRLSVLVEALPS